MQSQKFHLGDVLSVTLGRLLSPTIVGHHEVVNFMTGRNLCSHVVPFVESLCRPSLVAQYPWLDSPEINVEAVDELDNMFSGNLSRDEQLRLLHLWLGKVASGQYGGKCEGLDDEMMLDILPMIPAPESCEFEAKFKEMAKMIGHKKTIIIVH